MRDVYIHGLCSNWYYVAFMDAYPSGRISTVAPLTRSAEGWPQLVTNNGSSSNGGGGGGCAKNYPMPVQTSKTVASPAGTDEFKGTALSQE